MFVWFGWLTVNFSLLVEISDLGYFEKLNAMPMVIWIWDGQWRIALARWRWLWLAVTGIQATR